MSRIKQHKWNILFLAVVSLILILPPIIYQYPYPSISDDVPSYLQVVDKVADGDLSDADSYRFCWPSYGHTEYCNFRNAAPAVMGLFCRIPHIDISQALLKNGIPRKCRIEVMKLRHNRND